MALSVLLLIVALIMFLIAAIGVATSRFSLVAGGLFFWVLSILVGGGSIT